VPFPIVSGAGFSLQDKLASGIDVVEIVVLRDAIGVDQPSALHANAAAERERPDRDQRRSDNNNPVDAG